MKGKKHSAASKQKISEAKRIRWINDGKDDRAVPLAEVVSYLSKGWKLGRATVRDRKWVHDGDGNTKCVDAEDAIRLTYLGWQLGRVLG